MNILVTNDDGWGSPGIQLLEKIAAEFADVWVVAPKDPCSGIGHQMTFEASMSFEEKSERSFALTGTPADCARIGLNQLKIEFDWVFSGLNKGANLGSDLNLSGTVAAVREASLFGVNGAAFSQHLYQFDEPFPWNTAEENLRSAIKWIFANPKAGNPDSNHWFNVNLPDRAGILKAASLGSTNRHFDDKSKKLCQPIELIETSIDPNPLPTEYKTLPTGELIYCGKYKKRQRSQGSDVDVCFNGNISISIVDSGGRF